TPGSVLGDAGGRYGPLQSGPWTSPSIVPLEESEEVLNSPSITHERHQSSLRTSRRVSQSFGSHQPTPPARNPSPFRYQTSSASPARRVRSARAVTAHTREPVA